MVSAGLSHINSALINSISHSRLLQSSLFNVIFIVNIMFLYTVYHSSGNTDYFSGSSPIKDVDKPSLSQYANSHAALIPYITLTETNLISRDQV